MRMFCTKCGKSNVDTSAFCTKCGVTLKKSANQITPHQSGTVPVLHDLTGQVIDGKYQLTAKIGTGGMGNVYRANRIIFGDEAAIKILHLSQSQTPLATQRFLQEAKTSAKFKHINAVAIYDIGTTPQGLPFLVMELVQGKTLRQLLREKQTIPLDLIVTITMQICSALDEAHRLGIIHRDIKPENIVLSKTATGWQVKVLDFGIAKVQGDSDSNLTLPGNAMGTPQYMSPEQCLGENLDSRSDIYSFGIVLYEMLCGVVPFNSTVPSAVVVQHVNEKPQPLTKHNPENTTEIDNIVLKALEKQREKRPRTAGTLAREFMQAVTLKLRAETQNIPEIVESDASAKSHETTKVIDGLYNDEYKERLEQRWDGVNSAVNNHPLTPNAVSKPDKDPVKDWTLDAAAIQERNIPTEFIQPIPKPLSELSFDPINIESQQLFAELEEMVSEVIPNLPDTDDYRPTENEPKPHFNSDTRQKLVSTEFVPIVETQEKAVKAANPVPKTLPPDFLQYPNSPSPPQRRPVFQILAVSGIIAAVLIVGGIGLTFWYFYPASTTEKNQQPTAQNQKAPNGMVYIPGGEFLMGNDKGDEYEKPAQNVKVKPFYMDIYEVTCAEYKTFIDATNHRQPQTWTSREIPAGWEKRPVTGVNWDDANAYVKWAGKRLPTEVEWEFAARGTDGRIYPWGNDWQENMANANKISNEMKDVGSFQGKSPFGVFDMVGNAWEWTADDAKFYKDGKSISSVTKTLFPKIIRGGFFESPKDKATVTFRRFWGARDEEDYKNSGFRCAKD